jgi:hypothetical protein
MICGHWKKITNDRGGSYQEALQKGFYNFLVVPEMQTRNYPKCCTCYSKSLKNISVIEKSTCIILQRFKININLLRLSV